PGPGSVLAPIRKKMPDRLASHILKLCEISPTMKRAELRKADRVRLIEYLTQFELPWTGHAGYHKAEVTGGGIVLSEVHPKTLESRKRPGLYLCGEILDVFGPIGGYNFLWAWATGRAAGIAAGESASQSENEIQ
ncbi:MAG: NAD(P)/FAD-dependent oxidoreductase, partial [Candidatus Lindowbacteria bacterium]|nr:NAD(P)/FAD-dependent oxidoreductase [Candidatus Lindowbacteria bacterium]